MYRKRMIKLWYHFANLRLFIRQAGNRLFLQAKDYTKTVFVHGAGKGILKPI